MLSQYPQSEHQPKYVYFSPRSLANPCICWIRICTGLACLTLQDGWASNRTTRTNTVHNESDGEDDAKGRRKLGTITQAENQRVIEFAARLQELDRNRANHVHSKIRDTGAKKKKEDFKQFLQLAKSLLSMCIKCWFLWIELLLEQPETAFNHV